MGVLPICIRGGFIWTRWWRFITCVRCIGSNQLQLSGTDRNCLELIRLINHECDGDTPWTRGTTHMRNTIRHECVGDTPWSQGNVHMRYNICGTNVLVTDGTHEAPYKWGKYIRHKCVGDRYGWLTWHITRTYVTVTNNLIAILRMFVVSFFVFFVAVVVRIVLWCLLHLYFCFFM
jgi:hypothetical protein